MRLPLFSRSERVEARQEPVVSRAVAEPVEAKSAFATLAAPDAALFEVFGIEPAGAGIAFSPELAMRCTASRAAIQAIAETIAALPIRIFKVAPDGTRERDLANPLDRILNVTPNGWQSAAEFREAITRDALLWGGGHAFINRASDGRVLELQRLLPGSVSVEMDLETAEPTYVVEGRAIRSRDMLAIRAPYVRWPLPNVSSPTIDAKEAICLALVLERHASQLFARGAKPSGVLSFPMRLTAAAIRPECWIT